MILLALLACTEPAPEGLPETWTPPISEGAWLYATPDVQPSALHPVELGTADDARFPLWLPMEGPPAGRMLATISLDAVLLPVIDAGEVHVGGLTWDAWSWIGHDPTAGQALPPIPPARRDDAHLWLDLPQGTYALVQGDQAWLARLEGPGAP